MRAPEEKIDLRTGTGPARALEQPVFHLAQQLRSHGDEPGPPIVEVHDFPAAFGLRDLRGGFGGGDEPSSPPWRNSSSVSRTTWLAATMVSEVQRCRVSR